MYTYVVQRVTSYRQTDRFSEGRTLGNLLECLRINKVYRRICAQWLSEFTNRGRESDPGPRSRQENTRVSTPRRAAKTNADQEQRNRRGRETEACYNVETFLRVFHLCVSE